MNFKKLTKGLLATAIAASASFAITGNDVTLIEIPAVDPVTNPHVVLTANINYKVTSAYYVQPNCTLEIRPGTWIYGVEGNSADRAAYILVKKGGTIIANGTPDSVIVMTAWGDDKRDPTALGPGAKGLWGGLIINGDAPVSNWNAGSYLYPEGITHNNDVTLSYGGTDTLDNSGILRYVSIRHGGVSIGSNSEVNGLTLYGVGKGTTIDYVEVYANYDDGIEWFGGNVNTKHIVSAFNCDDFLDLDMGYSGKGQFWFTIANEYEGARAGEWDGWKTGSNFTSNPQVYNVTMIGSGKLSPNNIDNQNYGNAFMLAVADSLKGTFANMVIVDGPGRVAKAFQESGGAGFPAPFGVAGGLTIRSSFFYDFGAGTTFRDLFYSDFSGTTPADSNYWFKPGREVSSWATFRNAISDPQLIGVSRSVKSGLLDPRPATGSPVLNASYATVPPADGFFTATNYIGAFNASDLWIDKWTKLSKSGIVTPLVKLTVENEELVYDGGQAYFNLIVKTPGATTTSASPVANLEFNGVPYTGSTVYATRQVMGVSRFCSFRVAAFFVKPLVDGGQLKAGNNTVKMTINNVNIGGVLQTVSATTNWKISR